MLITCGALLVSGVTGSDETAKTEIVPKNEPVNSTTAFIDSLDVRTISLQEIGEQNPDALDYLTTYGISRVVQVHSPNTFGWKYDFSSVFGSNRFTDMIIKNPQSMIGIHGNVKGYITLLGSVPAYRFSNDESWHYVAHIGTSVVILSGNDQSGVYEDCKIMCEHTYAELNNPEPRIAMEDIGDQIYPESSTSSSGVVGTDGNFGGDDLRIPNVFMGQFS